MSTLSESQVNIINTRDDVLSSKLRQNFAALKSAINDNHRLITQIATPGGTEVTNARDNFSTLVDNVRARKQYGNRVNGYTDFQVIENGSGATNNVQVLAGAGIVDGVGVEKTSTSTSSTITPSTAGKHRRIVVVIDSSNTLSAVEGAEVVVASEAPYPAISDSQMPLGEFIIDETSPVVIATADITDSRLPAIDPFNGIEYYGASATYDGSNRLATLTYSDKKGNDIVYTYSYTNSNLTSIVITYSSITITTTITYDSSNNVESQEMVLTV